MTLTNWFKAGWLRELTPDADYITTTMDEAWSDLKDSQEAKSADKWLHMMAYTAVLKAALAALAAEGYRPATDSHHHRALKSLTYTIGLDPRELKILDNHRKKRNTTIYGGNSIVTQNDAKSIAKKASEIVAAVQRWLEKTHPQLISPVD